MSNSKNIALNVARGLAIVEAFHGIWALLAPDTFANHFGMPGLDKRSTAVFARAVGGRNLGWGLSTLFLSFFSGRDNFRNTGAVLAGLVFAGAGDTWICHDFGQKMMVHLIPTAGVGAMALYLLS